MTPELLRLTRDAIADLLEEPGEIDGLLIERVLARHRISVRVGEATDAKIAHEEEIGAAYVNGASTLLEEARQQSVTMRHGLDEPTDAISIDELEGLFESMSEGD